MGEESCREKRFSRVLRENLFLCTPPIDSTASMVHFSVEYAIIELEKGGCMDDRCEKCWIIYR